MFYLAAQLELMRQMEKLKLDMIQRFLEERKMKIIDQRRTSEPRTMMSQDIPLGTVFSGSTPYGASTYLKSYSGVVDLVNPAHTWAGSGATVTNYQPVEVELVIKGNAKG